MKKKLVQITGVPALPLYKGKRATVFHSGGYTRTEEVQKLCRLPMGTYLLITASAVYCVKPEGTPNPARSAVTALCA